MADISVVYLSEDRDTVRELVTGLREGWTVWWDQDIGAGEWDGIVRREVRRSRILVPVISESLIGERRRIIADEMAEARKHHVPILPFVIGEGEIPLGFGGLSYVPALGWNGAVEAEEFRELRRRISITVTPQRDAAGVLVRPDRLVLRGKPLKLPTFVFSLSSFETQVRPTEGLDLLSSLSAEAALVSAYDIWESQRGRRTLRHLIAAARVSSQVIFLDSGNYEAYRRRNRRSRKNPQGWCQGTFRETLQQSPPDVAFSFDTIRATGTIRQIVGKTVADFVADDRALRGRSYELCPIVHLPTESRTPVERLAAAIVSKVAEELDPPLIAIPERELGAGLLQRVRTVRAIREKLNGLRRYCPLHLLGTGNPLSIAAFTAAGADVFDGLEWCRTVSDYDHTNSLYHFQHLDFFLTTRASRLRDPRVRRIVESERASYASKALAYNIDYFRDFILSAQEHVQAGHAERLAHLIPSEATEVLAALDA